MSRPVNYVIWRFTGETLGGFRNIDQLVELGIHANRGQPVATIFPESVVDIASGTPTDFLVAGGHKIVSETIRHILHRNSVHAEVLPVDCEIEGKRVQEQQYFYLNVLRFIDCVDQKASGASWKKIGGRDFLRVGSRLVLDESKVPSGCDLFQIEHMSAPTLCCSATMATEILASCTGVKFNHPETWRGMSGTWQPT